MDIDKPKGLTKTASRWWDITLPALMSRGFLSDEDTHSLMEMATCVDRMARAAYHLKKEGYVVTYPNGQSGISHWHTIWQKSAEMYNRLAGDFGMTPSARIKLKLEDKAADDAMKALLEGFDEEE